MIDVPERLGPPINSLIDKVLDLVAVIRPQVNMYRGKVFITHA